MFVDRTVSKVGQQYLYAYPAEVIREANALSEKMSNAGG